MVSLQRKGYKIEADPALSFSIPSWAVQEKKREIEQDPRTILEKYGYSGGR